MPELAELKLTADYINQTVKGKTFNRVKNNPEHQWKKIDDDKWDHYSGLPNPKYYS